MIFRPEPARHYCVHCLALGDIFTDRLEVEEHLGERHGITEACEGRDWVSGSRALELLEERSHDRDARAGWFALYLAGCYGVEDLLAAPPHRQLH